MPPQALLMTCRACSHAPASPAGHAFAAVISACAAGGQWQRAVSLFDEMLAWGVRPDVVSCTALITGERRQQRAGSLPQPQPEARSPQGRGR